MYLSYNMSHKLYLPSKDECISIELSMPLTALLSAKIASLTLILYNLLVRASLQHSHLMCSQGSQRLQSCISESAT